MTIVTKWASIATAAIVGISLGMPLPVPAFADPVSSSTVIPSQAPAPFQRGDLVRLRSGGPAMTVDSVKGTLKWTRILGPEAKLEKGRSV